MANTRRAFPHLRDDWKKGMKHAGNDLLWHWDPQQISAFLDGEAAMLS